MTDRQKFISGVSASLGRSVPVAPESIDETAFFESPGDADTRAKEITQDSTSRSDELMESLKISAAKNGWNIHSVSDSEYAIGVIQDICDSKGVRSVLTSDHQALNQLNVSAALSLPEGATIRTTDRELHENSVEDSKEEAFTADLGITGVDYGIAETGTVVIHPKNRVSRLVSLAPPVHIAVIQKGQVLESLDELFAMERHDFLKDDLAGSMNLISGPSKTADIEGTTVTGIHGPLEVHLLILE